MKKIIFLLLISTGAFAQIVQPRSTTTFSNVSATGTLKVASTSTLVGKVRIGANTAPSATLDVTGTMSVSGTSTLTGAVNTTTINAGANLYLGTYGNNNYIIGGGFMNFTPSGNSTTGNAKQFNFVTASHYSLTVSTNIPSFQITGATRGFLSGAKALQYESYLTAPTYTANGATTITTASGLHVEKPIAGSNITITNNYGISTDGNMLLGSAGLTGGNTGTVAVLSDAVFPVIFQHSSNNPADATTYYFGNTAYGLSGSSSMGNVTLPYNCTLVGWNYNCGLSTGTGESATLSIAGSTNYTLSTSITYSVFPSNFSGTGLTQSFSAGDVINAKLITPTWATNPTNTVGGLTLWFVRRQ